MEHIDDLIDKLDINENLKEKFKICNIIWHHKYNNGKLRLKLGSSSVFRKLKVMERHSLLFPTYQPNLILLGPIPFFLNDIISLGIIFSALIIYIFFAHPYYTILIIPVLWIFVGIVASLSLTKEVFFHKVIKNPMIKKMILAKEINVIPKEEFINEMLAKYKNKSFVSLVLAEFLVFFGLFLVLFCPHILSQLGGSIGVEINKSPNNSYGYIVNLRPNSPAELSGIKAGDYILEVNGKSTFNRSQGAIASSIKGTPGTYVNIKVLRGKKKLDFRIKRTNLKIDWSSFM